jgi:hypothetical protein
VDGIEAAEGGRAEHARLAQHRSLEAPPLRAGPVDKQLSTDC